MLEWVFIVMLMSPTFGGNIQVKFETTTEDGCHRLRKVIVREMDGMQLRFESTECRKIDEKSP